MNRNPFPIRGILALLLLLLAACGDVRPLNAPPEGQEPLATAVLAPNNVPPADAAAPAGPVVPTALPAAPAPAEIGTYPTAGPPPTPIPGFDPARAMRESTQHLQVTAMPVGGQP